MKELLEDVVEISQIAAESKGVLLAMNEIPECLVAGDDISLSRLFFNLIENAIKYSDAGGRIELTGFCENGCARLMVSDTGVGIPEKDLPRVFDRFYRVDPSRSPRTGGSGLGLAICRSIVEAHHGEIHVSSVFGRGTTFTVTLPIVEPSVADCVSATLHQS